MKKVIFIIISVIIGQEEPDIKLFERIKADAGLIVPGVGAERVVLGDNISDVIKSYRGEKCRISKPAKTTDVFKEIFRVESDFRLDFEEMHYFEGRAMILFKNREVSSIIGFRKRVTIDAVDLSRGVEYFILHYGNSGLKTITRGDSRIYLYQKTGMAIVDDNADDQIDMYIIFPPVLSK